MNWISCNVSSVVPCAGIGIKILDAENVCTYSFAFPAWGHSSAGRALQWHCRGRRFDPGWLHQIPTLSPSSRGLGHHPFTVATGVRIPVGTPEVVTAIFWNARECCTIAVSKIEDRGAVVQLVRMLACHAGGRGFESRPLRHSSNRVTTKARHPRAFLFPAHPPMLRSECDFSKAERVNDVPHLARLQASMKGKTRITIMLDNDVLDAFRTRAEAEGRGYQRSEERRVGKECRC